MRRITLAALATTLSLTAGAATLAAQPNPPTPPARQERARGDDRLTDRRDIAADRAELRRADRAGNEQAAKEIRKDLRQDRHDRRHDREHHRAEGHRGR